MRYSIPELFAFLLVSIALTCGALLGLRYALEPVLASMAMGSVAVALHAFFFERSPVQYCTLCTFFFALTVLAARLMQHRALRRGLRVVSALDPRSQTPPATVVRTIREHAASTRRWLTERGPRAAAAHVQELAQRDEDEMEQIYALLGSAVQVMLALGFFGTVWGISRSMFSSFTTLTGAAPEQITAGLKDFTGALSTALDTTVLGLVCAIVGSLAITAMRWAEVGGLRELNDWMRQAFGLEAPADADIARGAAQQFGVVVSESMGRLRECAGETLHGVHQELRALTEKELAEFQARCGDCQDQIVRGFQRSTAQAAEEFGAQVRTTGARLEQAADRAQHAAEVGVRHAVGELMQQGQATRNEVNAGLQRIEAGLKHLPEVTIRYPQSGAVKDVTPSAETRPEFSPERQVGAHRVGSAAVDSDGRDCQAGSQ